jgi:hypothetical protein
MEPGLDLLPAPAIHTDLAALPTLAAANQDAAGRSVEIGLRQSEGFADAQAGTPEQDDERSGAESMLPMASAAHHGDDLLDRRWVGRIPQALVARRTSTVVTGHRCRRTATAGSVDESSHGAQRVPPHPHGMEGALKVCR